MYTAIPINPDYFFLYKLFFPVKKYTTQKRVRYTLEHVGALAQGRLFPALETELVMKKQHYHIETFGCQMNKSDSDLMDLNMSLQGFDPADSAEEADIIIFNTCSVREHAESRALSRIRSVQNRKEKLLVLAGCMAQRKGVELVNRGDVDLAAGPYESPRIGELLRIHMESRQSVFISQDPEHFSERLNPALAGRPEIRGRHEWVTVTHGCENFCSYCIVPHVRGRLISFSSASVLDYIRLLSTKGTLEITLLGQNVNQYGQDSGDIPFHRLLAAAAEIEGIARINFITSHPKDFTRETLEVIRDHPNISRSLHLPLQSGSDRILKLMNRGYTLRQYLNIVEEAGRLLGDHAISTDLIVGFPGETDDEFRSTLQAVREIRFDEAYMYAYSPRSGTAAAEMSESITRSEKLARLGELIALQRGISVEKMSSRVNRTECAIIESISKKSPGEVLGKTFLNHPVVLPGLREDIGTLVQVRITGIRGGTLYGARVA